MRSSQVYKTYICSVQRLLPCDNAQKQRYLTPLEESIHTYLAEHSDVTLDTVYEEFGTPEMVAATYLENADPTQIKRRITIKRIVACILLVVLLVGVILGIISYRRYSLLEAAANGYAVEVIEELPAEAEPNPTIYESH